MRNFPMSVKDYAEYKMKQEDIEKRKTELQKQHDDLVTKISEGKQAIANMEATLVGLKGPIAQVDWTLGQFKEEKKINSV